MRAFCHAGSEKQDKAERPGLTVYDNGWTSDLP